MRRLFILKRFTFVLSTVFILAMLGTLSVNAQSNTYVLGPDQIHPTSADGSVGQTVPGARMYGSNAQASTGIGSWVSTGNSQQIAGSNNSKLQFFVFPDTFGLPTSFKIEDITRIAWSTYRDVGTGVGTSRTGDQRHDVYLTIYSSPWGTGRLQAEPMYSYNLSMPNATWITWDTASTGTNQLSFHDSSAAGGTHIGFNGGATWQQISNGPINWGEIPGSGVVDTGNNIPYHDHDVLYMVFETASDWSDGLEVFLDNIIIEIDTTNDGTSDIISVIDLEAGGYDVAFTTQPTNNHINNIFSVETTLLDSDGLTVLDHYNGPIQLTLAGAGTLNGTTTVNAVNGVANFTDLSIPTSGNYQLVANPLGLLSAVNNTSNTFTISDSVIQHNFTLYLEDFTTITHDLPYPYPVTDPGGNYFTSPTTPGVILQIGRDGYQSIPEIATSLRQEILTGSIAVGGATGFGAWRTPITWNTDNTAPIGPPSGSGTGDGKIQILIDPDQLLGHSAYTVADVMAINWATNRSASPTHASGEWYASIWGRGHNPYSTVRWGDPQIALINFEVYFSPLGLNPNDTWGTYSTDNRGGFEPNQAMTGFGWQNNPIRLSDFRNGPINWSSVTNSGSTRTMDYRNHTIEAIAFATGSGWGYQIDTHIDDLQIDLLGDDGNIHRILIDLEARVPQYASTPDNSTPINLSTVAGVPTSQTIEINNIGTADLTISIDTEHPSTSNPISYTPSTVGTSIVPTGTLQFDAVCDGTAGTYQNTINVTHNAVNVGTPVAYTINCEITEPLPEYNSNPAIGTTIALNHAMPSQRIDISNSGQGDLEITNIIIDNATDFALVDVTTGIIPAGTDSFFTVECLATDSGTYNGIITVEHNDLVLGSPTTYDVTCIITDEEPTPTAEPTGEPTAELAVVHIVDADGLELNGMVYIDTVETISIQFNNPVFVDTDTHPDSAINPANYILLEGSTVATQSCAIGVDPADTQIQPTAIQYDIATNTISLTFVPPLGLGEYTLIICGTTSIVLATDNSVHLNNGNDVFITFTVAGDAPVTPTPQPTVQPTDQPTAQPSIVAPTSVPSVAPPPAPTASQPEELGVTELPATGETPTWADILRRVLGW